MLYIRVGFVFVCKLYKKIDSVSRQSLSFPFAGFISAEFAKLITLEFLVVSIVNHYNLHKVSYYLGVFD